MKQLVILSSIILFLSSCYYDNSAELYPGAALQNCDTIAVSYTKNIEPLFRSNCGTNNSCHSASIANGNVILDNYASASQVDSQLLIAVIEHAPGFTPMPPTGKMSDCGIQQVKLWIQNGKPN
jgi:hypothetical protein